MIDRSNLTSYELNNPQFQYPYKFCHTNLKEGCYSISITTNSMFSLNKEWRGTVRVEKADDGICISGVAIFPFLIYQWNLRPTIYGGSTLVTKVV